MRIIEDKVLIFNNYPLNLTDGGPSGFLAHNLSGHTSQYYEMNSIDLHSSFNQRVFSNLISSIKQSSFEKKAAGLDRLSKFKEWCVNAQRIFKKIQAKNYKFIYFHDVWQLKSCLPLILPTQKVLLQCHCPELPSEEISLLQPECSLGDVEWAREAEYDAFSRADILIFPNHYTTRIYASLISPHSTIYYLSSGAREVKDLRQYPIDREIINLLYIGRRNQIKGFDIILNSFQEAYKLRKNLNLILLGLGKQILSEEGIYDIGFSSSPHQWIYNCDYVINCNRQSYFDLSVLETLSVGTPLIISTNFGHQQLAEDNSQGIIDIGEPTIQNLLNTLLSQVLIKKEFNQKAVQENKLLYQQKYSDSVYRKNLNNLLSKIIFSK
ncbi:glycosyltransferase [Scytonema sp. UIC 10036]|uniref:glycosyltransferase n=1 Tax=Scytonema sp. UIC 10036 TaxID=2304196 RepID=UPI0012DAB152|nr:glycosyltransferase [Scytonema sp. UIC 10036]MUG94039.1 glycosyltransferase [Scytonema sp. UIC 10036]